MRSQSAGADPHDRVGLQFAGLSRPALRSGASSSTTSRCAGGRVLGPGGGPSAPGCVAVVEELRQRLRLFSGMSPAITGLRGGASGPVPLDGSARRTGARSAIRCRCVSDGDRSGQPRPGPGGQPHLVVLDVIAADVTDRRQPGLGRSSQRASWRRALSVPHRRSLGARTLPLPQVAAHHGSDPGRGDLDLGPLGVSVPSQPPAVRGQGRRSPGRPPLARPASRRRRWHQRR